MLKILFLLQLVATIFMTGAIWVIQVVHYPLFVRVGAVVFRDYAAAHNTLITYVVLLPMVVEAGLALLWLWQRPSPVPAWAAWVGLALVGVLWFSTFFLQSPQHGVLLRGFDGDAHRLLVNTNWLRTVAWSLRSALLLWVTARLIG